MATTKLSTKGQVVIPKKIRKAIKAKPGTAFKVSIQRGKIVLEPISEFILEHLYGKFQGISLLESLEEEHAKEIQKETNI